MQWEISTSTKEQLQNFRNPLLRSGGWCRAGGQDVAKTVDGSFLNSVLLRVALPQLAPPRYYLHGCTSLLYALQGSSLPIGHYLFLEFLPITHSFILTECTPPTLALWSVQVQRPVYWGYHLFSSYYSLNVHITTLYDQEAKNNEQF